ncbi:unnamed protein product [Spirodela intermedia]|uniref:Uncharacterized protein n=1 Tax=Spirodela intermedia TaxID=51605 RepID=A0A7I8JLX1_SPIIN|nr:unnamed protein product [Spirodela intermedia]CAA6671158.1 unnamed protein product [Spirodela intermedia]
MPFKSKDDLLFWHFVIYVGNCNCSF